ncbi:MAG: nitrous-oxide reductase, partial [Chthoniobacterales bacterium]
MKSTKPKLLPVVTLALLALLPSACNKSGTGDKAKTSSEDAANAQASYVPPGQKDEYYLFYSGGHSGQVFVAGMPSMRHLVTIPVFSPSSGTGYGYDLATKKLLGDYTWGDVHHPGLSQTDSEYDGRWLF